MKANAVCSIPYKCKNCIWTYRIFEMSKTEHEAKFYLTKKDVGEDKIESAVTTMGKEDRGIARHCTQCS